MKNQIFLPIQPDGSVVLTAFVLQHLGIVSEDLLPITLPNRTACCQCEELKLSLTATCDMPECNGYTTDLSDVNIPQDLLDIADISIGEDITLLVGERFISFIPDDDNEMLHLMQMLCIGTDIAVIPLSSDDDE